MGHAMVPKNALDAANGIAFAIEQLADAVRQIDVIGPVIAPPAAALHRPDLGEASLPEPQDMLRHVEPIGHLADGAKSFRRLVQSASPPFARPLTLFFMTWLGRKT